MLDLAMDFSMHGIHHKPPAALLAFHIQDGKLSSLLLSPPRQAPACRVGTLAQSLSQSCLRPFVRSEILAHDPSISIH
jgi:hypothetical protein